MNVSENCSFVLMFFSLRDSIPQYDSQYELSVPRNRRPKGKPQLQSNAYNYSFIRRCIETYTEKWNPRMKNSLLFEALNFNRISFIFDLTHKLGTLMALLIKHYLI